MNLQKIVLILLMIFIAGSVFSEETEEGLIMPEVGISMEALLYLFDFEVGDAEELAYIYAGDNDLWQGRQPLPDGYRYQFYIVNFEEEHYAVFATDDTSESRSSIHMFYQNDANMDDFYGENVPEITWFDPNEPYIFLDDGFQLEENYYTDLSNQYESMVAEQQAAQANYDRIRVEYASLREDADMTEEELEEKERELLDALSELDSTEYRVEELRGRISELQAQIDALREENDSLDAENSSLEDRIRSLEDEIDGQHEEIAELEELRDPYKVRIRNLDREGHNFFLPAEFSIDDTTEEGVDPEASLRLVPTYIHSADDSGSVYFLASVIGEVTTEEQWRVAPQVVFSMPRELVQFKMGAQFGTDGEDTYLYRMEDYQNEDGDYFYTVRPSLALNVVGEETRVSLEGGLEAGDGEHAAFVSASYELTPTHAPWLSFLVDDVSATYIDRGDGEMNSTVYNASAGFDINFGADSSEDQWQGKHVWSMGIRAGYFLEVNGDNTVDDGIRVEFIPFRFTF